MQPEDILTDWKAKTDAATPGERYTRGKVWASYENMALNNWPRLLAAVESVLGLHTAAFIYPLDDDGVPDQGKEPITTFCEECTCEDTIRDIENWEWNEDRDTVLWPCATVRAITDALGGDQDAE